MDFKTHSGSLNTSEMFSKKLHHPCGMLDRDQRTTISIRRRIRKNHFDSKISTSTTNECQCPSTLIIDQNFQNPKIIANIKNNCDNFLNNNSCVSSDLKKNYKINNFNKNYNQQKYYHYNNNKNNLKNKSNLTKCEVKKCEENVKINSPIRKDVRKSQILKSHNLLLICVCLLTVASSKSNAAPYSAHKDHKLAMGLIQKECVNDIVPRLEKFFNRTYEDYSYFEACYFPFMINEYKVPVEEDALKIHKPAGYPKHMFKLHDLSVTGKGLDKVLSHLKTSGPVEYNELKTEIDTIYAYFKTVNYLIKSHIKSRETHPEYFKTNKSENDICESKDLWSLLDRESRMFLIMLEDFNKECMQNDEFSMDIGHNVNVDNIPLFYRAWKVYTEQTKIYYYAANSLKRLYSRLKSMA